MTQLKLISREPTEEMIKAVTVSWDAVTSGGIKEASISVCHGIFDAAPSILAPDNVQAVLDVVAKIVSFNDRHFNLEIPHELINMLVESYRR
jgi:hypothetical protein